MALVNTKQMLLDAQKNHYAIGAFNVENMEMMQAVITAAELEKLPVILQTTPSTLKYADTALFAAMAEALAKKASVPVAMHLDHGSSFELCEMAAKDGYTSLMIDGSKLPLQENIELAKRVVELAKTFAYAPTVEAELGKLGGKEDDLEVKEGEDMCTDPQEAKKAITLGVCKVNFATELRVAYTDAARKIIADESVYDPKKYGAAGRENVIELVRHRMRICSK